MAGKSVPVVLSARQEKVLLRLARSRTAPHRVVERSKIVLMSAKGKTNEAQGIELGVDRQRVRRWRHRWAGAKDVLMAADRDAPDIDLEKVIMDVLTDEQRSGTRPTFSPEQVASIIALACEPPSESDLPVSHWTPPELAREAVKRGIVKSISPRQVDRFLARRDCGPTRASTG